MEFTLAVLMLIGVIGGISSAQGTGSSTVTAPSVTSTAPRGDPNCRDKRPDCLNYGHASCTGPYESWAKANCEAFCGFCIPITTPFICEDKNPHCDQLDSDLCTNPRDLPFVMKNCVKFCHRCPGDITTTPIPDTDCYDSFERCDEFGNSTCNTYPTWSKKYCSKYCGFCHSNVTEVTTPTVTTTTPTPTTSPGDPCFDRRDCSGYDIHTSCCGQYEDFSRYNCAKHCRFCTPQVTKAPVCKDTIPNCNQLDADLCTNEKFEGYVRANCAGFCKVCDKQIYLPECARSGSTTSPGPTTPSTPPPGSRCIRDNKYYKAGESWYSSDCLQSCKCEDPASNVIVCNQIQCPTWKHNCEMIFVPGACCPILNCNYFNTIHGERTQDKYPKVG